MLRIVQAIWLALAALILPGCDAMPWQTYAEPKGYLLDYCGTKILIPEAYTTEVIDREGTAPSNFLMASWPSMNGWRTPDPSDERQGPRSRVRIMLGFGGGCDTPYPDRIEKIFREYKDGGSYLGRERPPAKQLPDLEGFKHFVRPHSEREMINGAFSETDIFIRRSSNGGSEALMICSGKPIKPNRYPQCKFYFVHPDNPLFRVEVDFDRNLRFDEFHVVETRVIDKLREFEAAAAEKAISDRQTR